MRTAHTERHGNARSAAKFARVAVALLCLLLIAVFVSAQVAHGHALSHGTDLSCPLCAMAHQPAGAVPASLSFQPILMTELAARPVARLRVLQAERSLFFIRPPPSQLA